MKSVRRHVLSEEENKLLSQFGVTQTIKIVLNKLQLKILETKTNKQFKIKIWACSKCNYFSNQPVKFKAHKRGHNSGRPAQFKCHICKYETQVKATLKSHMYTHTTDTRLIPCPFCNYLSRTNYLLNLHVRRHTGEKPYRCPHCDYQFATSCNLTRHVNRIHKKIIPPQKRICQLCSKSFPTRYQLDAHILGHTGERPFSCQHCKKGFTVGAKNNRHEKSCKMNPQQSDATWVANLKRFKCHLCDYSTTENWLLNIHLETHGDSKRYKCAYEYCEYQTPFRTNFMRHQQYHSGSRPFKCSACSASFASCGGLKQHTNPCQRKQDLNKNQGKTQFSSISILKPFKCDALDCDVEFRTKGGLMQHLNQVHSGSHQFKCLVPGCTKSFAAKNRLQIHIITHNSKLK